MKFWALAIFLLASTSASAGDIYQCQYSKAKIIDGSMGSLSFPTPAKVEVNGNSMKTFRPDGSFIISPKLSHDKGTILMADDGSKVYASAKDRTSFAFSDKIARTTEQWDKCTSLLDVQNEDVWIVLKSKDEMTDRIKSSVSISSKDNPSVSLRLSCESGSKAFNLAIISVGEIITDEMLTVRVDDSKAKYMKVSVVRTPQGSAAFTDVGNTLMGELSHGKKILVRYGEYSKGGVTLSFKLNGFNDAIHQAKIYCSI